MIITSKSESERRAINTNERVKPFSSSFFFLFFLIVVFSLNDLSPPPFLLNFSCQLIEWLPFPSLTYFSPFSFVRGSSIHAHTRVKIVTELGYYYIRAVGEGRGRKKGRRELILSWGGFGTRRRRLSSAPAKAPGFFAFTSTSSFLGARLERLVLKRVFPFMISFALFLLSFFLAQTFAFVEFFLVVETFSRELLYSARMSKRLKHWRVESIWALCSCLNLFYFLPSYSISWWWSLFCLHFCVLSHHFISMPLLSSPLLCFSVYNVQID